MREAQRHSERVVARRNLARGVRAAAPLVASLLELGVAIRIPIPIPIPNPNPNSNPALTLTLTLTLTLARARALTLAWLRRFLGGAWDAYWF